MVLYFLQLIARLARTREVAADSVIGSGTVSNKQGGLHGSSIHNGGMGYCCLAEVPMYDTIESGKPQTPHMRSGDGVRIEMRDCQGENISACATGFYRQRRESRDGA